MKRILLAALVSGAFALPVTAAAQVERLRPQNGTTVGVDVRKAFIGDDAFKWYSSLTRARVLAPINDRTFFLADWGLSIAGYEGGSDATLSNPEIGLVFGNGEGERRGFVSVVLPLAQELGDDDGSVGLGIVTDFIWPERYVSDLWSVNAGLEGGLPLGDADATKANFGLTGSVIVPTVEGADPELFARYLVGVSHDTETVRLRADLVGLGVISESGGGFGDRTIHELAFSIDGLEGGPGAYVKLPLDEQFEEINAIVGVTFTF